LLNNSERTYIIPVLTLIVVVAIIDSSFPGISPFILEDVNFFNLLVFSILVVLAGFSQYLILRKLGKKFGKILSIKGSKFFQKLNAVAPFASVCVLLIILLEINVTSSFHTFVVHIIIWVVYGLALVNMSLLVCQLLLWFRIKMNYMIFSYTIAICSILVNLTASAIYFSVSSHADPPIIYWDYNPSESSGEAPSVMRTIYEITSIATFMLIWISSILQLSHYAKKYGLVKFIVIVVAPLIYFVTVFTPSLSDYFIEFRFSYPIVAHIVFTVLISAAKPIGGFLFGFIFLGASKSVDNRLLKEYLRIAGYGVMILFTSNQLVPLISLNYPPFGTVTIIFLSLASYISFIGIYASAVCVAQDRELRSVLRQSSAKNISMFTQIGKSEMEKKLLSTAKTVVKNLNDETGFKTIEDDDYRKYISDAIREII
jgi:hypothetical protein